jgi:diguanylate cyclase
VKIDRSFLAEIPDSPDACAMVVAILGLARSLGLDAVAEGVETRAQLEFLVREDCGFAQGFYLASPVPAGEIPAAVAAGAARRPAGARR